MTDPERVNAALAEHFEITQHEHHYEVGHPTNKYGGTFSPATDYGQAARLAEKELCGWQKWQKSSTGRIRHCFHFEPAPGCAIEPDRGSGPLHEDWCIAIALAVLSKYGISIDD